MTDARTTAEYTETLADLQRRYAYNIPQAALDRLKYGSATNAAIAETEDEMHFFRGETRRMLKSSRRWLAKGNREMFNGNRDHARFYLAEWQALRARLTEWDISAK